MQQRIIRFSDRESLSLAAARELIAVIARAVEQHGRCSLVLSGGSSPRRLYELLAQPPYRNRIDWSKLHVFWSDERCVAPDDPRSNYHCARTHLLQHVPLLSANIHRLPGEIDPQKAALESAEHIRAFFKEDLSGDSSVPCFDCVLLGMGSDGHIASLFPGDSLALSTKDLVVATRAPEGMQVAQRLSMSLLLLAAARNIFFIICGRDKQSMLEQVLGNSPAAQKYPAARLCAHVRAAWFVAE